MYMYVYVRICMTAAVTCVGEPYRAQDDELCALEKFLTKLF